MRFLGSGLAFLAVSGAFTAPALAAPRSVISMTTHKREHVGQCFNTQVRQVTFRLFDEAVRRPVFGSGSKILFADGHENVEYDQVAVMDASRPGDPARLCVRSLPTGCPAGDSRGITYFVEDIRTGKRWESSDSPHPCDGA